MSKKNRTKLLEANDVEKPREPNHWAFQDDPLLNLEPTFADDEKAINPLAQFNNQNNANFNENEDIKDKLDNIKNNLNSNNIYESKNTDPKLSNILNAARQKSAELKHNAEENSPTIAKLNKIEQALKGRGNVSDDLYTDLSKSQSSTSFYAARAQEFYKENQVNSKPEETMLERALRLQEEAAQKRSENAADDILKYTKETELDRKLRLQREMNKKRSSVIEANRNALGVKNSKYVERTIGNIDILPDDLDIEHNTNIYGKQSARINIEEKIVPDKDVTVEDLEALIDRTMQEIDLKKQDIDKEIEQINFLKEQARRAKELLAKANKIDPNLDKEIKEVHKQANKIKQDIESTIEDNRVNLFKPRKIKKDYHSTPALDLNSNGKKISKKNKKDLLLPRKDASEEFKKKHEHVEKTLEAFQLANKNIKKNLRQNAVKSESLYAKSYEELAKIQPSEITNDEHSGNKFAQVNKIIDKNVEKINTLFEGLSFGERRARIYKNANIAAANRVNRILYMRDLQKQKKGKLYRSKKSAEEYAWDGNYLKSLKSFHENSNMKMSENPYFVRLAEINKLGGAEEALEKTLELEPENRWDVKKAYEKIAQMSDKEAAQLEKALEKTLENPNNEKWLQFFK